MPSVPVAVAVTSRPAGIAAPSEKAKGALPSALVVTDFLARKVLPSPPASSEKSRSVKVLLGVLARLPLTVVLPEAVLAEERAGLFCRPFGPESRSLGSLRVASEGSAAERWLGDLEDLHPAWREGLTEVPVGMVAGSLRRRLDPASY